jgi:hypothetical protein
MHTKSRDQTNIWTFRCFNRTQTSIVRIMNVTNFKTALSRLNPPGPSAEIRRL